MTEVPAARAVRMSVTESPTVNRRAKLTPDRRPKLAPLLACTTGSARAHRRPLRRRARYPGPPYVHTASRPPGPGQADPRCDGAVARGQVRRRLRQSDHRRGDPLRVSRWAGLTRYLDGGRISRARHAAHRARTQEPSLAGSDDGASCCSPHHAIAISSKFCCRSSGGGLRDRRAAD